MRIRFFLYTVFTGLLLTSVIQGQEKDSEYLKYSVFQSKSFYNSGDTIKIAAKVDIKDKFHIHSNIPSDPDFIKTELKFTGTSFTQNSVYYPEDKLYKFEFSPEKIKVYEKNVVIGINIIPDKEIKNGEYDASVNFTFQACNDKECFRPITLEIPLKIKIDNSQKNDKFLSENIFSKIDYSRITKTEELKKEPVKETPKTNVKSSEEDVSSIMESKGIFVGLLLIFLGGLALNLTPCVYPLIPITISYFGSQASGNRAQSILMGLFYALGMSVTYSALGVFAALTGSMFGTALQSPIVIIVVAIIFIALAVSMFGAYEIRIPQKLALAGNKNRSGFFGSFIMGLLVGFIAAPCIGPFVLSLLVYVGKVGATMSTLHSALNGFMLFFILSMGLGLPYVILAAFSSSLNKLPRSGEWMIGVKVVFGLILIGMAFNTLSPIIPKPIYAIVYPAFLILGGTYLIIIDNKGLNSKGWTKIKYFLAILAIAYGAWILKPDKNVYNVEWQMKASYEDILKTVESKKMPVMIDFYADWCAQCKELDEYTYTEKNVAEFSKKLNNIKVDLTKPNDQIEKKFEIKGLPVVVFMNSKGEEIKELRLTGFEKPEEFIKRLQRAIDYDK